MPNEEENKKRTETGGRAGSGGGEKGEKTAYSLQR